MMMEGQCGGTGIRARRQGRWWWWNWNPPWQIRHNCNREVTNSLCDSNRKHRGFREGLLGQYRTGGEFRVSLFCRNRTGREFKDGFSGHVRVDRKFKSGHCLWRSWSGWHCLWRCVWPKHIRWRLPLQETQPMALGPPESGQSDLEALGQLGYRPLGIWETLGFRGCLHDTVSN